jgi:hypothetical protein
MLSSLSARAHQAILKLNAEQKTRPRLDTSDCWRFFVTYLADLFEQQGQPVTATKPSGRSRHSQFTRFAWAVMQAVPKDYREHSASCDAMAHAISKVLGERKGSGKSSTPK